MTRSIAEIESDLVRTVEAIGFCQEYWGILKHETRAEELRQELKEARAAKRAEVSSSEKAEAWEAGATAALNFAGLTPDRWLVKLKNPYKAAVT